MQRIQLANTIKDTIKAIDQNTTLFYQQKNKESYLMLNNTLNVLIQVVGLISVYNSENSEIYIDEEKLNVIFGEAMKAMEKGDMILFSDILVFDLTPLLEECYNKL